MENILKLEVNFIDFYCNGEEITNTSIDLSITYSMSCMY